MERIFRVTRIHIGDLVVSYFIDEGIADAGGGPVGVYYMMDRTVKRGDQLLEKYSKNLDYFEEEQDVIYSFFDEADAYNTMKRDFVSLSSELLQLLEW